MTPHELKHINPQRDSQPLRRWMVLTAGMLTSALMWGCSSMGSNGMAISEVGSMHVGGRQVTLSGLPIREIVYSPGSPPVKVNPNGDFEAEQMYVQYIKQVAPKAKYPLLMWHGGGLSGVTWETRPDGHPGWQQFFLAQGHDVYVSDAVERGRASWSRYPEIYTSEPFFRTKKEAWELFRIGPVGSYQTDPSKRVRYDNTQFDVSSFDQFTKQSIPRWSTNDASTQAAYDELVQKVCPCVIVVHSQGGNFAFKAALKAPDKIKAIVAVEPSGTPNVAQTDLSALKAIPHLFVWGDRLDENPFWLSVSSQLSKYHQAVAQQGGVSDWMSLPQLGIRGNSHMMMMDRNADQIAQRIQAWMTQQGLMK